MWKDFSLFIQLVIHYYYEHLGAMAIYGHIIEYTITISSIGMTVVKFGLSSLFIICSHNSSKFPFLESII
jgi:hypothetical protein